MTTHVGAGCSPHAGVKRGLKDQAEEKGWSAAAMAKEFEELEYHTMRDSVLKTKVRCCPRT